MHVTEKKKQYKSRVRTKVLDGLCNNATGDWVRSAPNKSDKQQEMSMAGMAGGKARAAKRK